MSKEGRAAFWDLAAPLLAAGTCEGTIMSNPCLRMRGEFVAMYWEKGGGMIVKLEPEAVRRHLSDGLGGPFMPAGRVFKAWLSVPDASSPAWAEVLDQAVELARQRAGA